MEKSKKFNKGKKALPNFKALLQQVPIAALLDYYGLSEKMTSRGDQWRGLCPIHQGENKNSFSVNVKKNIFKCFSCGSEGNVLEFVMAMEDCTIYQAGCKLVEWFPPQADLQPSAGSSIEHSGNVQAGGKKEALRCNASTERVQEKKTIVPSPAGNVDDEVKPSTRQYGVKKNDEVKGDDDNHVIEVAENYENKPLTFTLKKLNVSHPYLLSRVLPATVEYFGLGVCGKGLMVNRLVVPIHNEKGQLVAYAGRRIDEDKHTPAPSPEGNKADEKYKFPSKFKKGQVLFNLHRVHKPFEALRSPQALEERDFTTGEPTSLNRGEPLILVEGFFDVFRLYELGYKNVVALMGVALTKQQETLLKVLLNPGSRLALMFDNDQAGTACRDKVLQTLNNYFFIKTVPLPEGITQPDQLQKEIIFF